MTTVTVRGNVGEYVLWSLNNIAVDEFTIPVTNFDELCAAKLFLYVNSVPSHSFMDFLYLSMQKLTTSANAKVDQALTLTGNRLTIQCR